MVGVHYCLSCLVKVVIPAVRMRRRHIQRATLIIGAGRVGQQTKRLLEAPSLGLKPVAFLDEAPLENGKLTLPVLGGGRNLDRLVTDYGVEHVVITFSLAPDDVLLGFAKRRRARHRRLRSTPLVRANERPHDSRARRRPSSHLRRPDEPEGLAVRREVRGRPGHRGGFAPRPGAATRRDGCRRSDFSRLADPLPAEARRMRWAGIRHSEVPDMHLPESTEEEFPLAALLPGMAPGGVEGDDRRTRIGRFLRRTSIDELPQLVNVLRGEMSIIGPRPERPAFVEVFLRDVHRYSDRHRVRSGITGWARVQGLRGKTSVADRVEWDNYYIDNWSLWLDLKVMLLTVRALVTDRAE